MYTDYREMQGRDRECTGNLCLTGLCFSMQACVVDCTVPFDSFGDVPLSLGAYQVIGTATTYGEKR